jgi:hypothetical protein
MYMYVSGMAAAESLKATGGGEAGYQSVKGFNVNQICRAEESYPCRRIDTPETAIPAKW